MNTNFFKQIATLNLTSDLNISISKGSADTLIVCIRLQNDNCGDSAKNIIPPYNLKGTPDELDEGFIERITTPLKAASGLMDNMEAFLKQMEEAKQKSAIEKEKLEKEKKEKLTKEKKFKEAMDKAAELEKQGKFREAWMKVPDPSEYPEKTEAIQKRKGELSQKFSSPSLF